MKSLFLSLCEFLSPDSVNEGLGSEEGRPRPSSAKHRKKMRTETVEKTPSSLLVEELGFGLGFDPFFRKLSSAFDEAGAQGLLLNQLPTNPYVEVCRPGVCSALH